MTERKNVLMSDEATVNIGALQQRVYGLKMGLRSIGDNFSSLSARVETLFAGLLSKIEERSRPQYPLLISIGLFGLAVIAAVGGLAYAPIRENQSDLKLAMVEMAKTWGVSESASFPSATSTAGSFLTQPKQDQASPRMFLSRGLTPLTFEWCLQSGDIHKRLRPEGYGDFEDGGPDSHAPEAGAVTLQGRTRALAS